MASKKTEWKTATHEPLRPLEENLWVVDAELSLAPIGRRMTIFRLPTGELALHSAVACDEPTMNEIGELGEIGAIVVPSGLHRIDAPRFKTRFPNASVVTTELSARKVGKVVTVDGLLESLPSSGAVRHEVLDGAGKEAVWILESDSASEPRRTTLVFNDILMNLAARLPGFTGWLVKVMGSTGGPKVTFDAKLLLVNDKQALADHLRRLTDLPGLYRLIPAHGAIIESPNVSDILRDVAERVAPVRS